MDWAADTGPPHTVLLSLSQADPPAQPDSLIKELVSNGYSRGSARVLVQRAARRLSALTFAMSTCEWSACQCTTTFIHQVTGDAAL